MIISENKRNRTNNDQCIDKKSQLMLPAEVMVMVFGYLPVPVRFRISIVSKYWRNIVQGTGSLWREIDLQIVEKINDRSLESIINITKDTVSKVTF